MSSFELSPDDFINDKYSRYFYCIQKSTSRHCFRKILNEKLPDSKNDEYFNRCIQTFASIKHPAIVPFIGFYIDKKDKFLVHEKIEKGSLNDLIQTNNKNKTKDPLFDETRKLIILYGVSCAMEYLHSNEIMHRNLTISSIMLDSELFPHLSIYSLGYDSLSHFNEIKEICIPPEVLKGSGCVSFFKADVYAFAYIIYSVITEKMPFENMTTFKMYRYVVDHGRPQIPSDVSLNWKELMTKCWFHDSFYRPSFSYICDYLESDKIVNEKIDVEVFECYKKIVKPLRGK